VNEADGYRLAKIQEAQGAGQRFVALYDEYAKAKDVTRQRLYLEAMEEILPRIDKIVIDDKAGEHTVPYLPLDQMLRPRAAQSAAEPEPRR
jgi:membrane protease subunit HflK